MKRRTTSNRRTIVSRCLIGFGNRCSQSSENEHHNCRCVCAVLTACQHYRWLANFVAHVTRGSRPCLPLQAAICSKNGRFPFTFTWVAGNSRSRVCPVRCPAFDRRIVNGYSSSAGIPENMPTNFDQLMKRHLHSWRLLSISFLRCSLLSSFFPFVEIRYKERVYLIIIQVVRYIWYWIPFYKTQIFGFFFKEFYSLQSFSEICTIQQLSTVLYSFVLFFRWWGLYTYAHRSRATLLTPCYSYS